jgi:hypothetical protein
LQLTLTAGHSPVAKTAKAFSQLHYLQRHYHQVLLRPFSTRKSPQQIPVKNSCQHSLQLQKCRKAAADILADVKAKMLAASSAAKMP